MKRTQPTKPGRVRAVQQGTPMTYRVLFVVLTLLAAAAPGVSRAQAPDAARIAAAKEMMQLAGAAAQFDQVMP